LTTPTLLALLLAAPGFSQAGLEGRWEGTVETMQGNRPAMATFKRDANGYTGTISGMRGDLQFKEVKVDGNNVKARAETQNAQGATIAIAFDFMLAGDSLKGKGEVEFNGQTFSFNYDMKRGGAAAAAPAIGQGTPVLQAPAAGQTQAPGGGQGRVREAVPQPVQQQSRDYFVGQWKFKWLGRDSALSAGGPREGTVTFTPVLEGKYLEMVAEGKSDAGPFKERGFLGYDPDKKSLTLFEQRPNGIALLSLGDWSSPIAIRMSVAPVKSGGQELRLRRVISVVAAHSWTITVEISVDAGAFQRVGRGVGGGGVGGGG
jgi:hypothetical protein